MTDTTQQNSGEGNGSTLSWTDGFSEEQKTFVEGKKWTGPVDLLTGYQNFEKIRGAPPERILTKPATPEDTEGWGRFYDQLGRPAEAKGYELAVPDGMDPAFAGKAAEKFHELGFSRDQGQKLTAWWNEFVAGEGEAKAEADATAQDQEIAALKTEHGQAWDGFVQAGRTAAQGLGYDADGLQKLEDSLGSTALMSLMGRLGKAMGEDDLGKDGKPDHQFGMSPGAAKSQIIKLKGEKDFGDRMTSQDKGVRDAASAEFARLHKIAYPE